MPAGCEFICKNEECQYFDTGFNIVGPWPIAKTEIVIKNMSDDLKKDILSQGKDFARITFPNTDKIISEGVRESYWSPEAKCIWEFDYFKKDTFESKCPKTGCDLLTFSEVLEHGIDCPNCKQKLNQHKWFTQGE